MTRRKGVRGRRPSRRRGAGPDSRHQLRWAFAALGALLGGGTLGYVLLEGWGVVDALYMTVITVATVGYGETHPLSPAGRVFTMGLILASLVVATLTVSTLTRTLAERWFGDVFWRSLMKRDIAALEGHYIVCGAGHVGARVRAELLGHGLDHVVVERDAQAAEALLEAGTLVVHGDATREDVLERARIRRAAGLVAALHDDAANVFVTMTARELCPDMPIVARATEAHVAAKLTRAGATRVVSPYDLGGRRMVQALLNPHVVDFVDDALARESLSLHLEHLRVEPGSRLAERAPKVGEMRGLHQVSVIGLRKPDGEVFDMPSHEARVEAGDSLLVVGRSGDCRRLVGEATT
jgi:voltage-gated potassium channel